MHISFKTASRIAIGILLGGWAERRRLRKAGLPVDLVEDE